MSQYSSLYSEMKMTSKLDIREINLKIHERALHIVAKFDIGTRFENKKEKKNTFILGSNDSISHVRLGMC